MTQSTFGLDSPPMSSSPPTHLYELADESDTSATFGSNIDENSLPTDVDSLLVLVRQLAKKLDAMSPLSDPSLVLHASQVFSSLSVLFYYFLVFYLKLTVTLK